MFDKELPVESVRNKIIDKILNEKKGNLNYKIIGYSLCNRKIESFEIGNKGEKILFAGGFHGMEWITCLILYRFLYEFCEKKVKNRIVVVPCVNPDGVEISLRGPSFAGEYKDLVKKIGNSNKWQANARGVDINHNFDAGWQNLRKLEIKSGINGPSNTRYGGEAPESEPETKSIVKLCSEQNFDQVYAFHSQGEEIYWDYGGGTPKKSEDIAKKIAILTGYKINSPRGLAVGGGFKDWFIEKFAKPGFTLEVGKGVNPLPIKEFNNIYTKLYNLFNFLIT